ncbi:hypothetical protein Tco_1192274, partial [Tanacetum coccineum]
GKEEDVGLDELGEGGKGVVSKIGEFGGDLGSELFGDREGDCYSFRVPTAHDMELLIKTLLMPLSIKSQNDNFRFEHELITEMHEDFEYVKSLKNEVDELESEKVDFSYMYDLLIEECVSKDVICSYLHSMSELNAHTELQCMYLHKVQECECLAQKLSKHSISLELSLQHCKEQIEKTTRVCKENVFKCNSKRTEQYHKYRILLQAQCTDNNIAISELRNSSRTAREIL